MTVTAFRLPQNPLITPADVSPLRPHWEVVSVCNAAAVQLASQTLLLLRVAERPPAPSVHADELVLDFTGAEPRTIPLDPGVPPTEFIPIAMLDVAADPPAMIVRYVRRDTPGLDVSDPRLITYGHHIFLTSISHLRLARSSDGVHFSVEPTAAIQATDPLEAFGVEDPRITEIDGRFYINYTAVSPHGIATALASTRDFTTYEKHGVIFYPEDRNVTIFPATQGGRYMALHRPVPQGIGAPAVWFATSSNLREWGGHRFAFGCRPGMWDSHRIGGGAVPIRTERGWLAIYHGVNADYQYAQGAVLLDPDEPWRVLARSAEPILKPEAACETEGFFGNVIFTCGCITDGDWLRVYYGAADTVMAAADFSIAAILASLQDEDGR